MKGNSLAKLKVYIKKHFPGPFHLVFGYIIDGEENDASKKPKFSVDKNSVKVN